MESKLPSTIFCIPSRSRSELITKGVGIWRYVKHYPYGVVLFVREEEQETYRKAVYEQDLLHKVHFFPVSNTFDIARKRDAMLKLAIENNFKYLIMSDDDITISKRDNSLSSKYATIKDVQTALLDINYESITLCNEQYPLVGYTARFGAQERKFMFEKNTPMLYYACYYLPVLFKEDIKFTDLNTPFGEDAVVQLSLLSKGYRSLTNCRYAIGDRSLPRYVEEGGKSGGCHDYRTLALKEESAKLLSEKFPEAVTIKRKEDGSLINIRKLKFYLDEGELPYIPKEEVAKEYGLCI